MSNRRIAPFLFAAPALLFGALWLHAGPLNPPGGPVTGTYKTLSEVEPRIAINTTNTPGDADSLFKITAPGSYYLIGNITGVVGKHGVEIAVSGVTLDLNGFDLLGVAGMGGFDGVSATVGSLANIAVVNGSVRNWGDKGIDLSTLPSTSSRIESVIASGNAGVGISANDGCAISRCAAYSNGGGGIGLLLGGTVTDCEACHNSGTGISAVLGALVTRCRADFNSGSGISVQYGCTVSDCTVRGNTLDGIVCHSTCLIRGNSSTFSGYFGDGANIHAISTENRIEGNHCADATRGIDVDAGGNFIVKNTCSHNTTDWVLVSNNVLGPILDRRSPLGPAINGTSAASTLGSTDANANFTY